MILRRSTKNIRLPRDFDEKAHREAARARRFKGTEGDNETAIYALQMIAGRD